MRWLGAARVRVKQMEAITNEASRGFSTRYEDHLGLIHKLARRGWGRLTSANVFVDFEDVVQEMSLTYVKAVEKYDPEYGVTFSAYLGRAIWNQFNKVAEKMIDTQVELKMTSLDAMSSNTDGDDFDVLESIESDELSPEQYVDAMQQFRKNLQSLGPAAKFIVSKLINPSQDLVDALDLAQREAAIKRQNGQRACAPREITIAFIAKHYQLDTKQVAKARKNLTDIYGVSSRGRL